MKINLREELEQEIDWHVQNFVNLGWEQEDISYLTKDIGILVHPDSINENWKSRIGIVLYPELLHYSDNYYNHNLSKKKEGLFARFFGTRTQILTLPKRKKLIPKTTPWICGRITLPRDNSVKYQSDSKVIKDVVKYMKEELKKLPIKPFYDEDAFYGNFSKPKNSYSDSVETSFYLNKDYPDGWWQNHTIE